MSSHGAVFRARFAPLLPTSHLLQIVGLTLETVPPMRSPPWHNGSAIFCRARVADLVVIETACLEPSPLCSDVPRRIHRGKKRFLPTNFLGHNLRGAKSLESASNQSAHACGIDHRSPPTYRRRVSCKPLPTPEKRTPIPKYVKNIFSKCSELVGAPSPHLPRGGGSTENVRKVFGKFSELLGVPSPTPPPGGGSPENARKMFGTCSELGVAPLPHPSSGWWFPRKCSESVQKMLGTCRCPSTTPPPGWWFPLKCSKNVRQIVRNC